MAVLPLGCYHHVVISVFLTWYCCFILFTITSILWHLYCESTRKCDCLYDSEMQRWLCLRMWIGARVGVFEYLDPADGLLGLHHSDVLGGVPLRQQLSGAQVVSSKDNPINQVFWLTGSWDWARERQRGWWLRGRQRERQSMFRLKGWSVQRRRYFNYCSQCAAWRKRSQTLEI